MNNLGELYYNGEGVAKNYAKAREWYEKAAAAGNTDAMFNLGVLYDTARAWRRTPSRRGNGTRKPAQQAIPVVIFPKPCDVSATAHQRRIGVDRAPPVS